MLEKGCEGAGGDLLVRVKILSIFEGGGLLEGNNNKKNSSFNI